MRDVATAQAVQRRLEALRFDWASESVREVLGPTEGTAAEAAERCLAILRRFCDDVADLVRMETADWMLDFGARPAAAPAAHPVRRLVAARPDRPPAPRLAAPERPARTCPGSGPRRPPR